MKGTFSGGGGYQTQNFREEDETSWMTEEVKPKKAGTEKGYLYYKDMNERRRETDNWGEKK